MHPEKQTPVTEATEDLPYVYDITAVDNDAGDNLTITASGLPAWLTLTDNGDGTATLSGTPAVKDAGTVDIVLTVTDGAGVTDEQFFTVEVEGVDPLNSAPVVTDYEIQVNEDESVSIVKSDFDNNYSDSENDPIHLISIINLPGHGTLTLNGILLTDPIEINFSNLNSLIYTPDTDFNGNDQFNWNASDANLYGINAATVLIFVSPVNDPPTDISLSNQTVQEQLRPGTIVGFLTAEDGDIQDSHTYSFSDNNNPDSENFEIVGDQLITKAELDFEEKDRYEIRIKVTDEGGLSFEKLFEIIVLDSEEILFQTGITPNSDGFNDTWKISQIENCPECIVEIYDRWGKKVFYSLGYGEEWDGTLDNELLPAGTYYYVIEFKNGTAPEKGAITILK
jgi:gliding motility-associated-like protein